MLIERKEYSDSSSLLMRLEDSIFKYCSFKNISVDGKSIDAIFLCCEMSGVDWYWGLFNGCLFVDTQFENCVFRGSNFADCRFLNCQFVNCQFEEDNFGSLCSFEGSKWFECTASGCVGLPESAFPVR
jgi:uncharacterized protein YjbI with pentapeptide repeats